VPLYEDRKHAVNQVLFDRALAAQIVTGFDTTIAKIVALVAGHPRVALDGWYGIDSPAVAAALSAAAQRAGLKLELRSINEVYRPQAEIEAYRKRFTDTGDPGFGWVNLDGKEQDIMLPEKIALLREARRIQHWWQNSAHPFPDARQAGDRPLQEQPADRESDGLLAIVPRPCGPG